MKPKFLDMTIHCVIIAFIVDMTARKLSLTGGLRKTSLYWGGNQLNSFNLQASVIDLGKSTMTAQYWCPLERVSQPPLGDDCLHTQCMWDFVWRSYTNACVCIHCCNFYSRIWSNIWGNVILVNDYFPSSTRWDNSMSAQMHQHFVTVSV